MPKYLLQGTYSVDGLKGLLKEGATSRRRHFAEIVGNLGGKVEAFYFAFGADDFHGIVELPDNTSIAALSLAMSAGGAIRMTVVVLISPEEIEEAAKKSEAVRYRPPGQ